MKTFDLAEVRDYAANLHDTVSRCVNGEGMECATLDAALRHHATLCCDLREGVRAWGREVFAGRVAFDPEVEALWLDQCGWLYARAADLYAYAGTAEVPCYTLEGRAALGTALLGLWQLLQGWVTPKRSVGPAARLGLPSSEGVSRKVQSLPPPPNEWKPADPQQSARFRWLLNAKRA